MVQQQQQLEDIMIKDFDTSTMSGCFFYVVIVRSS